MSCLVSIIIPVYNSEIYIEECIKSLLNQTLKDCEFIFVNDGSVDNSRDIIIKYRNIDSRIKLIDQINQGVSIARNRGIEVATGEYIGFVDSDDYIEHDMYEKLYNTAIRYNSDIVLSNFEGELDGHKSIAKYEFPIEKKMLKSYIKEKIIPYFIEGDNLNTVCNKLYKYEIIEKNNIYFPEKVALGEDGLFNLRYFLKINSFIYINYTGYHYREVKDSATRNIIDTDYFKRAIEVFKLDIPEINEIGLDKNIVYKMKANKLMKYVLSYIYIYLVPNNKVKLRYRYKYVKDMVNNRYVRDSLPIYIKENYNKLSRYEKIIINMIKNKSIAGLYIVTNYSYIRNNS